MYGIENGINGFARCGNKLLSDFWSGDVAGGKFLQMSMSEPHSRGREGDIIQGNSKASSYVLEFYSERYLGSWGMGQN
jgi:hypothetical protein